MVTKWSAFIIETAQRPVLPIKTGTASPFHRTGTIDGAEKRPAAALERFGTERDDGE
jgi:hypothetical protein